LGLLDLKKLNAALRARWLWFQKADADKPWSGIGFEVSPYATAIFNASVSVSVGDGGKTLFWEDPWIAGLTVGAIAPDLIKLVRPGIRRARTVQHGLLDASWVRDIAGQLSVNVVVQFFKLWGELRNVALGPGRTYSGGSGMLAAASPPRLHTERSSLAGSLFQVQRKSGTPSPHSRSSSPRG
jgi:hypothetical protein